jgi:hypothetical protein
MQTDKSTLLTYVFYFMDQARHPGKRVHLKTVTLVIRTLMVMLLISTEP